MFPLHMVGLSWCTCTNPLYQWQLVNNIQGGAISDKIIFNNHSKTVECKWLQYSDLWNSNYLMLKESAVYYSSAPVNVNTYPTWLHAWFSYRWLSSSPFKHQILWRWLDSCCYVQNSCQWLAGWCNDYRTLNKITLDHLFMSPKLDLCFYKVSDIKAWYRVRWGFDVRHQGQTHN